MVPLVKSFPIKARDYIRGGEVSIAVRGLLKKIGFSAELVRKVSVCAFEAEMNVVMHGGDGSLTITLDTAGIVLDVKDDGPGIEDIALALKEGYSTASEEAREMGFGAGMGLPNIKKNAKVLEILSEKGKGTHLKMFFHLGENA